MSGTLPPDSPGDAEPNRNAAEPTSTVLGEFIRTTQPPQDEWKSDRFVRRIADVNPAVIYVLDLATLRPIYISANIATLIGYSGEEIRTLDEKILTGLVHHEDLRRLTTHLLHVAQLADGQTAEIDYRVRHADGSWQWLHARDSVFARDERGAAVQIIGCVLNITDRKATEMALLENEQRLNNLIHNIHGILWEATVIAKKGWDEPELLGPKGIDLLHWDIRYFNEEIARQVLDMKQQPGETFALAMYHARLPGESEHMFRASALALQRGLSGYQNTFACRDKFGNIKHLQESVSILQIGKMTWQLYGVITDITDRVEIEHALTRAKIEADTIRRTAEDANRAKDQFLAVLSHELRTPLTPALTAAQLIELDTTTNADTRDSANIIRRNIELEARLIDDLLDLTRISRGKLNLHLEPSDVQGRLRDAITIVEADIQKKNITFVTDWAKIEGLPYVLGDSARLQQAFWNVLKNAVKFTPAGGTINLRTEVVGPVFRLIVRDTGVGIDTSMLTQIFDPFQQGGGQVTRIFGGLGLGLAITKALVDAHGGTIHAQSEGSGRGATFTIELPLTSIHNENKSPVPRSPGARAMSTAKNLSVLLVEDHVDTANALSLQFRRVGWSVQMAHSVREGIELAGKFPFDVLVSDLGLPDGTGLDLMKAIRVRFPNLSSIALSGYGMEEDVRKAREAGFDEHLTKPVNIERLLATIEKVTAASASR